MSPLRPHVASYCSAFHSPGSTGITVQAVIDPLSKEAQRTVAIMAMLKQHLDVDLSVWLAPHDITDDKLPIQNFYRSAFATGRGVTFDDLPNHTLLTMKVDIPEPWNVQTRMAGADLDNIRLAEVCEARSLRLSSVALVLFRRVGRHIFVIHTVGRSRAPRRLRIEERPCGWSVPRPHTQPTAQRSPAGTGAPV
jgi:hypothetical protein